MNVRIKELAKEHGFVHDFMTVGEYNDALQKFEKIAEVIIKECMDVCKGRRSTLYGAHYIKEHFGVEE